MATRDRTALQMKVTRDARIQEQDLRRMRLAISLRSSSSSRSSQTEAIGSVDDSRLRLRWRGQRSQGAGRIAAEAIGRSDACKNSTVRLSRSLPAPSGGAQ